MSMMKIYEAKTLISAMNERINEYSEFRDQMVRLKKAFQNLIGLDGFEGKGAEAIKGFYGAQVDVVNAWIDLINKNEAFMKSISGIIEEHELSGDTVVHLPFLEDDVSFGLNVSEQIVTEQQADLKATLNKIDDLVPIETFCKHPITSAINDAEQNRSETIEKVNSLDSSLKSEYSMLEEDESIVAALYRQLLASTEKNGQVTPLSFNETAYQNSDVFQMREEARKLNNDYLTMKNEQEDYRRLVKEQKELEYRALLDKAWDAARNFTGEFSGYYEYIRVTQGIDPVTKQMLSEPERVTAGALAAAGFFPAIGWGGRKGADDTYTIDAYKNKKGFDILQKSEMGIYGLASANGVAEGITGIDLFGNEISEEKRRES